MPAGLDIAAAWERTDEGSPEERACALPLSCAAAALLRSPGVIDVAEFQLRYNNRENADIFGTAIKRC